MGILDGIVDWLATQVMNLLDLASTSVLGALDCNMDTFKRYFPAASAMYEIYVTSARRLSPYLIRQLGASQLFTQPHSQTFS